MSALSTSLVTCFAMVLFFVAAFSIGVYVNLRRAELQA